MANLEIRAVAWAMLLVLVAIVLVAVCVGGLLLKAADALRCFQDDLDAASCDDVPMEAWE